MPAKQLPVILTEANWNKNKGVIAKMHGETGIGAALRDIKVAWDKVDWTKFDPQTLRAKYGFRDNDPAQVKAALAQAEKDLQAEFKDVEAVRAKLLAFNKLAATVATKFKNSPTIPASSRKLVEDMNKTSSNLAVALKSIDQEWKGYVREVEQKEKEKYAQLLDGLERKFGSAIAKADTFISAVKSAPTADAFNSGVSKAARDLTQNHINSKNAVDKGYLAKKPVVVTAAMKTVAGWANAASQRGDLKPDATREDVLAAVGTFEQYVKEIKAWLAG